MKIADLVVDRQTARVENLYEVPSGTVGATISLSLSEEWEGLDVTVVFSAGSVKMDWNKNNWTTMIEVVPVPWEVLEDSDIKLMVGVYGCNKSGKIVMPTKWATLMERIPEGVDPSCETPSEPTPTWRTQVEESLDKLYKEKLDKAPIGMATDGDTQEVHRKEDGSLWTSPTGSHGVTDYNDIDNKPRINDVELVGNITTEELGIKDGKTPVKGVDYFTQSEINEIENNAASKVKVPTKISELETDPNNRTVTDDEKQEWNNKQPSGDYATKTELKNGLDSKQDAGDYILNQEIADWAKQPEKPTYTAAEVKALPDSTEIPNVPEWAMKPQKPQYTAEEVGALSFDTPIPKSLSELTDDSEHRTVTDAEKEKWNTSGSTYELPIASSTQLGGVQPDAKGTEDTQPVTVDEKGKLWTGKSSCDGKVDLDSKSQAFTMGRDEKGVYYNEEGTPGSGGSGGPAITHVDVLPEATKEEYDKGKLYNINDTEVLKFLVRIPGVAGYVDNILYPSLGYKDSAISAYGENVYIFGGYNNSGAQVKKYNLSSKRLENVNVEFPYNHDMAYLTVGKTAYIFGGYQHSKSAYKFDMETETMTKLSDLPFYSINGVMEAIDKDVFLFGGRGTNKICKFNIETEVFSIMPETLPVSQLVQSCAVSLNGSIYCIGGENQGDAGLDSVIKYTPGSQPENIFSLPRNCSRASWFKDGNEVFLIGGLNGSSISGKIIKVNLVEYTAVDVGKIPVAKCAYATCNMDGKIYMAGGRSQSQVTIGELVEGEITREKNGYVYREINVVSSNSAEVTA